MSTFMSSGIGVAIPIRDRQGEFMNDTHAYLKYAALLAIFILFGTMAAFSQSAESVTGDRFNFSAKTPKGAKIKAVKKPSAAMLNAIDKGLTDLFTVSRKNNYTKRLRYSDYTIYIAKADRTKDRAGNYSPDFAVGAAQYAGTDFDQGGYIYAAGMVLNASSRTFVIAEHTKNYARAADVVRYEGEHIVLYHNDRARFNRTADHSKGGGHPILK